VAPKKTIRLVPDRPFQGGQTPINKVRTIVTQPKNVNPKKST
jgi:hypothetical protein